MDKKRINKMNYCENNIIGKYLAYTSDDCCILGVVERHFPSNVSPNQYILKNGSKIIHSGIVTREQFVVDLDGIFLHSTKHNGIIKFIDELNLDKELEDKIFLSILSEDNDNPKVGFEHLIASNLTKFVKNEKLINYPKKH